jgi:hypothetical protein
MICTFCYNKGIPAPHNHSVRHWTMPNRPIICPELLATQCSNCNMMGHTKLYCPTKNTKETKETNNKKRALEGLDCLDHNAKYQKHN